jgi:hypothetical protein
LEPIPSFTQNSIIQPPSIRSSPGR